ncbi:MAG: hypothetical protein ABII89_08800 [Candidatus Omnitrophota bacterium]
MKVRYLDSFVRAFESLANQDRAKTTRTISDLLEFLENKIRPSGGLGLKKLRKNLWEVRVDIKTRVLFLLSPELITFVLIGSHGEIRKYLKTRAGL